MQAAEFAKTHQCDPDWIAAMGVRDVLAFNVGQRGTYSGFSATVLRHYRNGMYEVRVPGGVACISGSDFVPANQKQA